MKKVFRNVFTAAFLLLILIGCSTTKRIADDEVLYTGVKKMEIIPDSGVKIADAAASDVRSTLSVAPNNPLFSPYIRTPFPIGLWVWNYMEPKREKGLKHWIYEKLAKEPVLISTVQPELRMRVVKDILGNNGYFGAKADYELIYNKRNPKKARIKYRIEVPEAYTLDTIELPAPTTPVTRFIDSINSSSILQKGDRYCLDSLSFERNRITTALRNNGYFYFRPEYIEYLADTTLSPGKVALRMTLKKGIPAQALKPYYVGDVTVRLNRATGDGTPDTIRYPRMTVAYYKPIRLKKWVLPKNITFKPGEIYSIATQNETQSNLGRLGIFRTVAVEVTPLDSLIRKDSLDVTIQATFDVPLEATIEANVSSKSNSYIGPGLIFGINHNNVFGGGEKLSVKLNGSYEWQTGGGSQHGKASLFNSYEVGLNSSLTYPRIVPGFLPQLPRTRKYPAYTRFQLGANLMNRPHYFRMVSFNGSMSYDYRTSLRAGHSVTPFKLVYTKLLNTTESFDKTMEENPAIALSFRDQFIPSSSYTYTYDTSYGREVDNRFISTGSNDIIGEVLAQAEVDNRFIWQFMGMSAGNILSGITSLFGQHGEKHIFGSSFSQFVKGSAEMKYYHRFRVEHWLATRLFIGAEHAYGNSKEVPYSEQFYIGGANSIRAFTIRSLGPGSYVPAKDDVDGYFDQTGTFKLEANIEYRFPIWGDLHGAAFVDAGNIWLLKKDPKRPGGELDRKTFLKDIALGTGIGLRYDIGMLVLRGDLGIGIHAPYDTGKKGYYNMTSFKNSLAFHLAIGYPF